MLCIWILICLLCVGYAKSIFFLRELSQIFEKYILLNWIVHTKYSRKDSIKEGNFYKALIFSGAWVNLNAKISSEPTLWSSMELRVKLCPSLTNHQLPEGDFASVTWLITAKYWPFDTFIAKKCRNETQMNRNWKILSQFAIFPINQLIILNFISKYIKYSMHLISFWL